MIDFYSLLKRFISIENTPSIIRFWFYKCQNYIVWTIIIIKRIVPTVLRVKYLINREIIK